MVKHAEQESFSGFTLLEMIAVLVILGILCVAGLVRYQSMVDVSRQKAASSLLASAQSQLALEYSHRLLNAQDFDVAPQDVCNNVSLDAADATVSLTCSGNLSNTVNISAAVDDQTVNGAWSSPATN